MLLGALVWAVLVLTLLPALEASMAAVFPTLLPLCGGGVVGLGVQAALRNGRIRRRPLVRAGPAGAGSSSSAAGSGGVSAARRFEQLLPGPPGWT